MLKYLYYDLNLELMSSRDLEIPLTEYELSLKPWFLTTKIRCLSETTGTDAAIWSKVLNSRTHPTMRWIERQSRELNVRPVVLFDWLSLRRKSQLANMRHKSN